MIKFDLNDITSTRADKDHFMMIRSNIKEILNGKSPFGLRCIKLSDFIIALESTKTPTKSIVFSTNLKDFLPLCAFLKTEVISYE